MTLDLLVKETRVVDPASTRGSITKRFLFERTLLQCGLTELVESSPDLVHWVPIQTDTVPVEGLPLSVSMNQQPGHFIRAVVVTNP